MFAVIGLFMIVRWTILRFKFDQLMALAWKGMMPLGLMSLIGVAVSRQFFEPGAAQWIFQSACSFVSLLVVGGVSLVLPREPQRASLQLLRGRAPSASSAPELSVRGW